MTLGTMIHWITRMWEDDSWDASSAWNDSPPTNPEAVSTHHTTMRSSTTGAASSTTPTIMATQAPTATTDAATQAESTTYSTQIPKQTAIR